MVKVFYYIIGLIFLHFVAGWMFAVLFTALVSGIVFREHIISKSVLVGFVLNSLGIIVTISLYPEASWNMMVIVDESFFEFSPYIIPVISVGLPTLLYALAAYFSSNAVYVYRKLNQAHKSQSHF